MRLTRNCSNLLLVFILVLAGCTTTTQTGAMYGVDRGKVYFQSGQYAEAFKHLQPIAAAGNSDAQYAVGYMYYYGKGTPQDKEIAIVWMRKAAAQDQPLAAQALKMIEKQPADTVPVAAVPVKTAPVAVVPAKTVPAPAAVSEQG